MRCFLVFGRPGRSVELLRVPRQGTLLPQKSLQSRLHWFYSATRGPMKHTILSILQQRMDKCTNEQWWAVAALTAADAFIVTRHTNVGSNLWVFVAITVATIWGICIIIQRHFAYHRNRAAMALLVEDEQDVPAFLKSRPNAWSFRSVLSGVLFYVVWVLLGWILCSVAILADR